MNISENDYRDYLFNNHKESLSDLITGKRDPVVWKGNGFPPISFLLQQIAEQKINSVLDGLESLLLTAKELRLTKTGDSTTRIDLFGHSETNGLTIIELKKSNQTERQAYTELLAYANHFSSIFPGLTEQAINSILVAPMETRTVRDAFVQELLGNNKNAIALIPHRQGNKFTLSVYYPDESYFKWFENNLFDDRSMIALSISFPDIAGWIDSDRGNKDGSIPCYSKDALNTIANKISHKLEAEGFHCLTYSSQKWGEIGQLLPYPNSIFVVAVNPFAGFRTTIDKTDVYGECEEGRILEVQSIYNQLVDEYKEHWIESLESNFHDLLIKIVKEEFEDCFINTDKNCIKFDVGIPDWYGLKTSMIDSVFTHNLDIYLTGLLRSIYKLYIKYIYQVEFDEIHYCDDLPMYSYKTYREFFPVWQILRGIGFGSGEEEIVLKNEE